jgi:thiol:disulfide interchange protein DsbA
VNRWKARLPADVRLTYVHAAFGGAIDNLARGFYAAETLGATERTHDAFFRAFHVDRKITTGSPDEVADVYASLGLDRKQVLDTMNSFGVTSKVNRAKQFAQRTGVNATPTIIVAGKYRVSATADRGFDGMLQTIDYLVARERAAAPARPAAAPAAAPKPAPAR